MRGVMPLFRYKALSASGRRIAGVIDADSLELAKERLRQDKILVTGLDLLKDGRREHVFDGGMLLAFTRELSQLLTAGLPLYESLLTIEEKYRRHRSHSLLLDLCDRLKMGLSLSQALKIYPKTFDSIYTSMVEAGEKTGSLPWVFEQLYQLIERRQKLKKQLMSAMAYPLFLGCFSFVVIIALLLFVIPSMRELFQGRDLHPLTRTVLALSGFVQNHGILLLLILSLIGASIWYVAKHGSFYWHKMLIKIPLLNTLITQASLIRFCRSASVLLFGGIPLVSALSIARKVMNNPPLEEVIARAETHIVEGQPLSQQLKASPLIPALVPRMLALAEETGKMAPILQNIADIYDQELERNLTHVTTFLQPAMLLLLGGVVGLVILSILLPLTDVSSLIGGE